MKTTMTTKAVWRPFGVGMSKKVLPLPLGVEVICYSLHLLAFDVLCPFVTDGGKHRITHRRDADADAVQSGKLCWLDLNRQRFVFRYPRYSRPAQ